METIKHNVRDLNSDERRLYEQTIGRQLAENQQIIISVTEVDVSSTAAQGSPQTLDDWTHVYDGLSDEQIDEIDRIAKTRANLTRNLPA